MKRVFSWLNDSLEEFLMAVSLILMMLIMGIQVFSRYALGASLSWSEELTRYIFVWAGFLSVSYCTKKCVSIKIEQFAVQYLISAVESGQVSPACRIPMYYIQAAPLFSFLLTALRIIQRWYIELQVLRTGQEEPGKRTAEEKNKREVG